MGMLAVANAAKYSCFETKTSHHFVLLHAKNTKVGLQLPPEGTLTQTWSPPHGYGQGGYR